MTYQFVDATSRSPSEASFASIQTVFNGHNLDKELVGFRTLTVSGRGLLGRTNTTSTIPGRDGVLFEESVLPPRQITVKFQLIAESNVSFRQAFNQLNLLLHTQNASLLSFTDEPEYSFYAQLQDVDHIEENSNQTIASFSFICYDPYKYKRAQSQTGTTNLTIATMGNAKTLLPTKPDKITCRPSSTTSKVVVTNTTTGKKIVVNTSVSSGQELTIELLSDYPIKVNSQNKTADLDFVASDLDFYIKQGDLITMSPGGALSVSVRERLY